MFEFLNSSLLRLDVVSNTHTTRLPDFGLWVSEHRALALENELLHYNVA